MYLASMSFVTSMFHACHHVLAKPCKILRDSTQDERAATPCQGWRSGSAERGDLLLDLGGEKQIAREMLESGREKKHASDRPCDLYGGAKNLDEDDPSW